MHNKRSLEERLQPSAGLAIFLALLTVVNLIQAAQTPLLYDESYYWYFAQQPAWGYFDHPPMVAWWIAVGQWFFEGYLGIRLLGALSLSVTYWLLWKMCALPDKWENVGLFILTISGLALMNTYGFFMLPDTPLVFFGACFLCAYQRFLHKESVINILALSITMAGLMYSKYHGLLLILFVLLSNLKLLLNRRFLWAAVAALILYLPHFYWLYENEWVSVNYHLFDRNRHGYRPKNHLNYLIDQFGVGGLLALLSYWAAAVYPSKNKFHQALKYVFFGFLLFFFISAFQKKTQAQWVIMVSFPLVVFTVLYAIKHQKFRKAVAVIGIISVLIISYLRFALVYPQISPILHEVHQTEAWPQDIAKKFDTLPAVFFDSYKNASLYGYHTGADVFSANSLFSRENQFSLDDAEDKLQGQRVLYVFTLDSIESDYSTLYRKKKRGDKYLHIKVVENFESFRKAHITLAPSEGIDRNTLKNYFTLKVYNPYSRDIHLKKSDFSGVFLNERSRVLELFEPLFTVDFPERITVKSGEKLLLNGKVTFKANIPPDAHFLTITFAENGLLQGYQGQLIPIR